VAADLAIPTGSILEWEGALAHGFAFYGDVWLEFGPFKETHVSTPSEAAAHDSATDGPSVKESHKPVKGHPALILRQLGDGLVVSANFSLFSSKETTALRPYSRWSEVI